MGKEAWVKNSSGKVTHVASIDEGGTTRVYKAIDNTSNPVRSLLFGPVEKGSKVAEIKKTK